MTTRKPRTVICKLCNYELDYDKVDGVYHLMCSNPDHPFGTGATFAKALADLNRAYRESKLLPGERIDFNRKAGRRK